MSDDDDNIISLDEKKSDITSRQMVVDNRRKFHPDRCKHEGSVIVDGKEAMVECRDCGALLNPIYVLQLMAAKESYYRRHVTALREHLHDLEEEIKGRQRTKCTHCSNMTAIKFKNRMPQTWYAKPDY